MHIFISLYKEGLLCKKLQHCYNHTYHLMNTLDSMLFLGGGGSKEQSAELDMAFIDYINKTRSDVTNVAYIPVGMAEKQAKYPYPSCLEWFKDTFQNRIDVIEMWTDLGSITLTNLQDKGAVYIGGGDTDVLLKQIRSCGFEILLKQFIQEGGAYYGGSAGAIILGKDIRTAEEVRNRTEPKLNSFQGLNILQGYSIFPHFKKSNEGF